MASTTARIGNNGYQELNQSNLQNAIDSQFGTGKATVIDNGDGTFTVSFIDSKRDYNITTNGIENGIDWNEAMANAVAPDNQTETSKNVIGIGTDGNPVNMDLWNFNYYEDAKGYGLNDETSLNTEASASASMGYRGNPNDFTEDGQIIGTVPQYISEDGGKNYIPVTSMKWTFYDCEDLIVMPEIPSTVIELPYTFRKCINLEKVSNIPNSVTSLQCCFYECTSLEIVPVIPNSVTNLQSTFCKCTSLETAPVIPNSVTDMYATFGWCTTLETAPVIPNSVINMNRTFRECTSLIIASNIPEGVINMQETFYGCSVLTKGPSKIPSSVTEFYNTFRDCPNLSGTIEIYANLNGTKLSNGRCDYEYCFKDSATDGEGITLRCSENVYNLFYNENKINSLVSDNSSSNITIERINK